MLAARRMPIAPNAIGAIATEHSNAADHGSHVTCSKEKSAAGNTAEVTAALSNAVKPKRAYACTSTMASTRPIARQTENEDSGTRVASSNAASTVALPRMRRTSGQRSAAQIASSTNAVRIAPSSIGDAAAAKIGNRTLASVGATSGISVATDSIISERPATAAPTALPMSSALPPAGPRRPARRRSSEVRKPGIVERSHDSATDQRMNRPTPFEKTAESESTSWSQVASPRSGVASERTIDAAPRIAPFVSSMRRRARSSTKSTNVPR
jgi:hypothetical protein